MSKFCYFLKWEVFFMRNQGITVWVGFNADRMTKDQTNHRICRLYHRIIKYIKQVYLEIWQGKEWICFLLNLPPVFSPIYLFSLACTYFYLLGSLLICENLFLFMIFCENLLFFLFEPLRDFSFLWNLSF